MKKYVVLIMLILALIGVYINSISNKEINLNEGYIIKDRENDFDFTVAYLNINKGKYSAQDSVYVYMQLGEHNYFYSKYILTKNDVINLKSSTEQFKVRLQAKLGYEYELKYIVVDKGLVKGFEKKYSIKSNNLIQEPRVAKVLYSGSLSDQIIAPTELDNNDEKLEIVFYPTQLFTTDYKIEIIDSLGNHIKDITLTDENLHVLQNEFLYFEVDFSDEVNKKQDKAKTYHYFVKIYDDMQGEINNTYFNFKVDK